MTEQWISFNLAGEKYVYPVTEVKEVIPYQAPVPVPGSPRAVEGVVNMRGHIITVLSGRDLLDLEPREPREEWRIVTLETDQGQLGVTVDGVEGIVEFDPDRVETNAKTGTESAMIKGTVSHQDDLLILVDLAEECERLADQTQAH